MIIRSANTMDIPEFVQLRLLMLNETSIQNKNPSMLEFEASVQKYFCESLANQSYYGAVADLDGELISTGGIVFCRKPSSWNRPTGLVGHITNVYTRAEFRECGRIKHQVELPAENFSFEKLKVLCWNSNS